MMSNTVSTPEEHAKHDLETVLTIRQKLNVPLPRLSPHENSFASSQSELQQAQNFKNRQDQQARARRALATCDRLYRRRIEIRYQNGDVLRLYLSPVGEAFEVIEATEEDYLVSWAAPQYLALRTAAIHQQCRIGLGSNAQSVEILTATEIAREEPSALIDVSVDTTTGRSHFAAVRWDKITGKPHVLEDLPQSHDVTEPTHHDEIPETTSLGLGTLVHNAAGKIIEIQFALDRIQWAALTAHHDRGTIVLMGPPGAGKTTVALLRATALIQAAFADMVAQQNDRTLTDQRFLQRNSFRVIVVTENLRNYLKETLVSSEVAIPEAEVVNIRGTFLETFVRHRTLRLWIRGTRFRLAGKPSRVSDELHFIKAMPGTLRLCFYHAILNARENAGDKSEDLIQRIHDVVASRLEKDALSRVLNEHDTERLRIREQEGDFDLDEFLSQIQKTTEFNIALAPRMDRLRNLERQLTSFFQRWLRQAGEAVERAIDSDEETMLVPGNDSLLLSRFVDELSFPEQGTGMRKLFINECWKELVRLVDPRQVLLRVVDDFERTADNESLVTAGLTMENVRNGLAEWRSSLTGTDASNSGDDEELDDSASLEDLDDNNDDEPLENVQQLKGAFTRSDFPLLAAMARIFLAKPEEAIVESKHYKRVGFLLPDEKVRYDHVIVDEGQDFTYSEIHLVRSLVETSREAVTICGDPFQRMDWRSGFSSLETISPGDGRAFQVIRNYRQTVELCQWVHSLSRSLFGKDVPVMEPSEMHGPAPVIHTIRELKELVPIAANAIAAWFGEDRNPFTAVLTIGCDSGIQTRFATSLRKRLEDEGVVVERIGDGRLIERGRVNVCEVPTVKGLEFDGVLVWVSRSACELLTQNTPQARVTKNMLYVACSRAKRNLTVIFQVDVPALKEAGVIE